MAQHKAEGAKNEIKIVMVRPAASGHSSLYRYESESQRVGYEE